MFRFDRRDRRGVTVAAVITLIALPSLWLMNRDDQSSAPNVATAGIDVTPEAARSESGPATIDALGSAGGAFLDRDGIDGADATRADSTRSGGKITIAVPTTRAQGLLSGRATFRSSLASTDDCIVAGAPSGRRVTVTNVDNGHAVSCVARSARPDADHTVVLHTEVFGRIANLADAPIPVEITW